MVNAVLRLVLLALGFLILAFFVVIALRYMGLHQSFTAPSHPWFEREFWGIYNSAPNDLCQNPDLDQKPGQNWIVTIPLKRHEEEWLIPCTNPMSLTEFLKRTKHRDFLLNILAHDTWSLDKLVEIIKPYDETKHFAVTTDSQKVAMFLRKKAPQWLFAADSSSLLRLRTFESFYIESVIDFWPDFVISNLSLKDKLQIDERTAAELLRRKKRLIWNWTDENLKNEAPFPIQGVMTNRPTDAQEKWSGRL